MTGRLYGVGVGPGDPELLTLKAARLIGAADVVAFHAGRGKESNARRIAAELIPSGAIQERLEYPVTTGVTDHPGGYAGAIADFYERSAQRLAEHLAAGRDVVLLSEGDPLFYGSFMYMHDKLAARFETEIVPGIPAFAAATAAAATPLVRQTDVLTVLPGTLPEPELARRLADTDGAIIMKLGRNFPAVRRALEAAGRLDGAVYVERASTDAEAHHPVSEVDPDSVPYFSLIVVPGDSQHSDPTGRRPAQLSAPGEPSPGRTAGSADSTDGQAPLSRGVVHVVGLGPGPQDWLTPEATRILSEVDHVVGYAPYVDRVPQRAGLRRHCSGNTVEVDRAALALELAGAGEQVAVVSGGDAGVFGMASAVFEAAEDPRFTGIDVHVAPGVSAVQAVAARAGAPIGADFAVVSLSDRLKPWDVIDQRLDAIAAADLVLAVYNPASRSRTHQVSDAREVILRHRCPTTPVVVGRDVGRAEESLTVTTLGELDCGSIDMKCLLIVGASGTRITDSGRVWSPRFVRA
ncbi:precorrin-2 C(20)-methyltransferase [Dietzia maris]|uniref:precorrin-2 C(20)-methyltransferase n=1 Tax=Dietzia TaxID=37914 RepID=UPI0022B446F9|nr:MULTISPECIES: precorrin-2 C(20)-methyltransferase [Dietzia]MCZ4541135.1 precorrin-2 C(20)-methyltransferase [Dietzia maris]MCZ4656858.1 precorrin-2 C(20)-methyltransferase [Dietzia kunjamensis]MDV3355923.1 precorrin-2 C(20)-methyltransferase [Dietzia sp. IN118]